MSELARRFRVKTIPHRHHAAGKTQAIPWGGIGAIQLLVRKLGLAEAIDDRLHLLKYHLPYHESDHVLNFAYNVLCNGTCLDDIELRRNRSEERRVGKEC